MHAKSLFALTLLAASTALAVPTQKRAEKGIAPSENVEITDAERAALAVLGGPQRRGLETRDTYSKSQCGHLVSGKGGSNGHGKWIPVATFTKQARNFCDAYAGSDVAPGHETSDTYPTTLTNQDDASKQGPDGFIVFAVYNQADDSVIWTINSDTCYQALITPLGDHASKRATGADGTEYVQLGKRDDCWGHKHNDYKGGYTKVNDKYAIGSEIYIKKT